MPPLVVGHPRALDFPSSEADFLPCTIPDSPQPLTSPLLGPFLRVISGQVFFFFFFCFLKFFLFFFVFFCLSGEPFDRRVFQDFRLFFRSFA